MSQNHNDLDRDLQALFRGNSRRLEAEPFARVTLKRIEHQRFYRKLAGLLLRLFVLAGIVVFSPALIRGSVWLSDNLGRLFTFGGDILGNPKGTLLAVLIGIAILLANARRRFQRL